MTAVALFRLKFESFGIPPDHDIYIFLEQASRDVNEWWRHQEDEGIPINDVWDTKIWAGNDSDPVKVGENLNLWLFAAKSNLFVEDSVYNRKEIKKEKVLAEKEIKLIVNSVE